MKRFLIFLLLIFVLTGCEGVNLIGLPLSDAVAARALEFALTRINYPYVYGGQGPDRFDCSGLVIWSYAKAFSNLKLRIGTRVVRDTTADKLWRYNVIRLQPENLEPGDLVFITNKESEVTHVGLFIRWVDDVNFEFVHASSTYKKVIRSSRSINTQGGYWYVGAGRMKMAF